MGESICDTSNTCMVPGTTEESPAYSCMRDGTTDVSNNAGNDEDVHLLYGTNDSGSHGNGVVPSNDVMVTEDTRVQSQDTFCSKIQNVTGKIKSDRTFRHKFVYSLCLIGSFFILGWRLGQVGPSLLDLQLITGVSLETAAFYVTSLGAGYMMGSLLGGILYDRLNKFLQVWVLLVGLCVSVTLIPWCTHAIVMLSVQFVEGMFQGCIDTVCCAEMVSIWNPKISQSFMQALHFGFATGGILSPLVTAPFLAPRIPSLSYRNTSSFVFNSSVNTPNQYSAAMNQSATLREQIYKSQLNMTIFEIDNEAEIVTSRLYVAYGISGAITFLISLPFLIMYFRIPGEFKRHGDAGKKRSNKPLPLAVKVTILTNMCALSALYTGLEETFVEFLSAFCVEQMDWSKTQGSIATSLYFGSIGFGHFINIFTVRAVDQVKLMGGYCIMLILVMIGLTISAEHVFHPGVWISSPLVGLSLSIIYPIIFTWTEDAFLPVTGRISSLFILTGAMGSMINPVILGVLMDERSPMWYCFLLLTESILQFVFYLSGRALHRFVKVRYHKDRTCKLKSQGNCPKLKPSES